ncbi:hypothetical protein PV762_26170 [Mitsuaria sp. CC2]|uniref:hypothetical protein n=1 Tax=Mitsuaria sp. CC2 TaxID=3029186 RepID=UPI003B8A9DC8
MVSSKLTTTGGPVVPTDSSSAGASTNTSTGAPTGATTSTPSTLTPTAGVTTPSPSGALQGLPARAKRAVFGREVAFNAIVPGVGGTVERPVRASLPTPQSAAPTDATSQLAALSAQAQGLNARLPPHTPSPWNAPTRSTGNRLATIVVPWLKPRPLTEEASTHADKPQPGNATPVLEARSPITQAVAGGLQPLAAEVQTRQQVVDKDRFVRQRLDDTKDALYGARSEAIAQLRQPGGANDAAARATLHATDAGVSAVLQASMTLASRVDTPPDPAVAKAAFDAREAQALQAQATRPRGFAPAVENARFGALLLKAVNGRPANPSADALPSIGVMEIASELLSVVCKGDATRAREALAALQSRPTRHWMQGVPDLPDHGPDHVSESGAGHTPTQAESDVRNLLRQASVLPRGAEVVHLLGDPQGSMPDSETLQAMRSFWSADAAQRVETDAAVRQWLAGAKRVARQLPAEVGTDITGAGRAAYHAVRNGCLSNSAGSPYARHDARMNKAIGEWLSREDPSASWLQRVVTPHRHKTPFTPAGLQRATAIAESFGMTTHRSQADSGVRKTAGELGDWARSDLARDLTAAGVPAPEARAFAAATQALAERATRQGQGHPAQWQFKGSEASELRAAVYALENPVSANKPARLHKPNREHPLPTLFEELAKDGASAPDALRAVIDHVKLTLAESAPAERQGALTHDVAMHEAADAARQKRFQSKEAVVRYFEPILLSMQLRDKVKLSGGGVVGGGLPSLPYSVPLPVVSPIVSAGWSRKEEAFFQAFMPILGMEISLGSTRASGPEATVGVAVGPDLPGVVKAQVSATEKMSRTHQETEGTILRLFRQRGKDDELRKEMLGVLDSWVRWDQVHAKGAPPYAGPLEAVLDRHPKVSLGKIHGQSLTRSFVTKVSAGANVKMTGGDGNTYRVGVSAGAALKAERIAESRTERGGHIQVTADKGDTAQQKLSVGVQVNTLTPANPSEVKLGPDGKDGSISGGGLPSLLDVNRDLFWNLEKNAVSPFTIGGKQDADLDRHFSTPKQMLEKIGEQRDDWIARCVETLEPDASGEKNTRANRDKAESLLSDFEAKLKGLPKDSLCQYNINFSMRPQASAWIDTFRALEGLAQLRGDASGAAEARANADRTMAQDSTWRPLMLIVREKGKDQRTLGWNFGVRLQRSVGVEGQRTAAQYPPP